MFSVDAAIDNGHSNTSAGAPVPEGLGLNCRPKVGFVVVGSVSVIVRVSCQTPARKQGLRRIQVPSLTVGL